jgi:menaquinone-9 beta-reductase
MNLSGGQRADALCPPLFLRVIFVPLGARESRNAMGVANDYEIVIAGGGPAGLATALHLLQIRPHLAGRIAAIERSRHPRSKICAGGLIPRTIAALTELGIPLEVPAVQVFGGTARTETGTINLQPSSEPLCTIVRRDEFDAMLARRARLAGLEIVDATRVLGIEEQADGVRVETDRGQFNAVVLVGADGSGSRVRRSVFGNSKRNIGRALVVEVPTKQERAIEFITRRYRFDFTCVEDGTSGYCWSFPCLIGGQPHLSVGIYDQRPRDGSKGGSSRDLLAQLCEAFPEVGSLWRGNERATVKAFPIRWYDARDCYVSGCTILAGDAAGVDPLMGEGISCAFEHGKLAAAAIARYLEGDRSALEAYGNQLHRGLIGRKLRRLAFSARRFYGVHHRFYFRLAGFSSQLQRLGIDWYNGANGLDERSIVHAALRVMFSGRVRRQYASTGSMHS